MISVTLKSNLKCRACREHLTRLGTLYGSLVEFKQVQRKSEEAHWLVGGVKYLYKQDNEVFDITKVLSEHVRPPLWRASINFVKSMIISKGRKVGPKIKATRLEKCGRCVHNKEGECNLCRCIIAYKTSLTGEKCPIGSWA